MKMYDPDKCSSFEMMFGFSQTIIVKKRNPKKADEKKQKNEKLVAIFPS